MSEALRILILEDNPTDAELIEFELQEAGFTFTSKVVMDEKDFVRELQEFSPDLILSDYDLPHYNGALALADAKRRCPDIPFILVTGAVSEDRAIEILTQGAKDYVLKTSLPQRLVPAVRRALVEAAEHKERKKVEAELKAASLYSRTLIEASLDPLVTISSEGKVMDVNKATEEITGVSREQIIGNDFSDYFTEPEKARAGYKKVFSEGSVKDYPLAIRHITGRVAEVLYNATIYKNEKGEVQGVFAAARDVTELKKAEEELREAHRTMEERVKIRTAELEAEIAAREKMGEALREKQTLLRAVMDGTTDPVYAKDRESRILMANEALAKVVGKPLEEIIGRTASEYHDTAAVGQMLREHDLKVMASGRSETMEETILTSSGSSVFLSNKAPYRNASGDIIGIIGISRDITARKHAEAELKHAYAQLQQSRDLYASLYDSAPVGYLSTDAHTLIQKANLTVCQFLGVKREILTGKLLTRFIDGASMNVFYSHRRQALETGAESCDVTMLKSDGSILHARLEIRPSDDGGFSIVVIDIMNRKKVEETLKAESARLASANKELEAFAYSASHDLKAPLRAIDGYSRMLLKDEGSKLSDEGRRRLRALRDNAHRMNRLIDDLLAFSRLGRQDMTLSAIDMENLVNQVCNDCLDTDPGRSIELRIQTLPNAYGDVGLMRQVLSNLVANAVKFTKPRGDAVIEIDGKEERGGNVYWIRDNGVGFDMAYKDKLFGVFQRLHDADEFKGTGVGLAIVQRIIHRHGGKIWAEGEVDKGATFYFTLPQKENK
jgi:PAS domain S-box-containing protein